MADLPGSAAAAAAAAAGAGVEGLSVLETSHRLREEGCDDHVVSGMWGGDRKAA